MEYVIVPMLFLLVVLAFVVAFVRKRQREAQERQAAVAAARGVAEEDVTRFGEDLANLDVDVAGRQLDEATRQDYRRALDAYDAAKQALAAVRAPEDVRGVAEVLEDGRYAMACVQARVRGEPIPARRPPCFFNPQHGPSVADVPWAPPGGAPRPVPVCAADADRVRVGAEPDSRKVLVGAHRRPYWEAGPAYAPWAQGYFSPYASSGLLPGILMGAVMTGAFGGWGGGYDGSYGEGYQDGLESGDGDYGGDYGDASAGGEYDAGGYDSGYGGGFDGGGFGE